MSKKKQQEPEVPQHDPNFVPEQSVVPGVSRASEGLYQKYDVKKVDDPTGKHDDCKYFVLDPRHDKHARQALRSYAASVAADQPTLAHELHLWVDSEMLRDQARAARESALGGVEDAHNQTVAERGMGL